MIEPSLRRCHCRTHQGDPVLPADDQHFQRHKGKFIPTCRVCHNRRVRKYRAKKRGKGPSMGMRADKANIEMGEDRVGLLLRGPAFGVPQKLAHRTLPCGRCFHVKPATRAYFADPEKRVEPVCLKCEVKV
jgi:hypothetical protein